MVTGLTPAQRATNDAGAALCREVVNAIVAARAHARPADEPAVPLTESELIHQRAVERAIGERRNDRLAFVRGAAA